MTRYWESIWQFNSNILQLLGIPGRILVPPMTQFFRSKWLHFCFVQWLVWSSTHAAVTWYFQGLKKKTRNFLQSKSRKSWNRHKEVCFFDPQFVAGINKLKKKTWQEIFYKTTVTSTSTLCVAVLNTGFVLGIKWGNICKMYNQHKIFIVFKIKKMNNNYAKITLNHIIL